MHDVDVAPAAPVASGGGAATVRAHDQVKNTQATRPGRLGFAHLRRATLVVIVLALVTVLTSTVLVRHVVDDSERRQLHQRTREASVVLQSLVDTIENPMRTAAVVLHATNANPGFFEALARPVTGPDDTIAAAALLKIDGTGGSAAPVVVAHTGTRLALTATPPAGGLGKVNGKLTLVDLLQSKVGHRLGLVLGAPAMPAGYALYAEAQFPMPGVSLR
ncbi:MAG: hypothetical protein QOI55_1412, partial [Actinomycetota bacterium]|nr:hypothetical protein [Actinomycetota bacterium]